MKNAKINKNSDDSYDSSLNSKDEIEPIYYQNIMTQKINKKLDTILSKEIIKRKKIIYDLFQKKFGPNFLLKKPESLNSFEFLLGKHFFSSSSKFLKNFFPQIYQRISHEKKVDAEKLKSKINMGSMMYLTLRKHLVSNKASISDKLLYISKNFSRKEEKDLVSNLYFKFKKNAQKRKMLKLNKHLFTSTKSSDFGNISQITRSKQLKINKDKSKSKDEKKVIFNIETENDKNNKDINENLSKTQNNFFLNRNKNLSKFKTSSTKNKNNKSLKTLKLNNQPSPNKNQSQYNKFYLSNPFYIYNSNICNRNINNNKISKSEFASFSQDNYNFSQMSLKPSKPNLFFQSSNIKNGLPGNTIFNSYTNSIPLKNNTISSINNIKLTSKMKKNINNIKIIPNSFSDEEDDLKNRSIQENYNKNDKKTISLNTQTNKKKHFSLSEKNSFDKILRKTKKFKTRLNSEVKLLNDCTNKCNKKLIKLIDNNFILSSKERQKNRTKNVNFDITKLLLDDKIPKKVFINYAKNFNTIKPIFRKTINDIKKFDKRDKDFGKKNFIKNINNIPTELALFFIGELYQTNHIKFSLKEFKRKREEIKLEKDEKNLKKLRIKSKNHLFRMKQLEYILLNEKDSFFNREDEKAKNLEIFKKIHDQNENT